VGVGTKKNELEQQNYKGAIKRLAQFLNIRLKIGTSELTQTSSHHLKTGLSGIQMAIFQTQW
jgi:hypothetical protein